MQTQDNNPLDQEEIIPFKAEHVEFMQIEDKGHLVFDIPSMLKVYEQLGGSFSYFKDGECLCCSGIITYWEGVGEAWFVMADNMDLAQKSICATVKKYLDNMLHTSFNRIQATVKADDAKAVRFIEWLGFEREALLQKYGFEGADYYLYARI